MHFASDNAGPAPQEVLEALTHANAGYAAAYGADPEMAEVTRLIREVFEAPEAEVFLVATGTTANVLSLACLARPFDAIFCSPVAHIACDESTAPEFYTGGARLKLVPGGAKMTPEALRGEILSEETRGVHGPTRGPVSLTQLTEHGTAYTLPEIAALTAVAREFGLPVHMDGARFANALVHLGCTPAEMSWKAGVDVLSFGGTKNGLLGVEVVIFFNPAQAAEFAVRRKRGGHLFSKHRYLSAQMLAYLKNDLWLRLAARANANCAAVTRALGDVPLAYPSEGNIAFPRVPRALHERLEASGAQYYVWEEHGDEVVLRLVCDWSLSEEAIAAFAGLLK